MRSIWLGVLAAFFFAFTFVLNRSMELFVLFYAPLCFASAYSPGWLIAGTWQITIISGSLLVPLFAEVVQMKNGPVKVRGKSPSKDCSCLVILIGIIVMQVEQSQSICTQDFLFGMLPVILASFAYPLGNRISLYEMLSAGMPRRIRPYSLLW